MKDSIPFFSLIWMTERQKTARDLRQSQQAGEDVTVIDVRQPKEIEETGIIEGSILIPQEDVCEDTLYEAGIREFDDIVIVCRSGKRSAVACECLLKSSFRNVRNLNGGILEWIKEGFPLMRL